jgi:hypothetical protein
VSTVLLGIVYKENTERRHLMSHIIHPIKNEQQGHPKVLNTEYLFNDDEPPSNVFNDLPSSEIDAELLGSSYRMRQQLRHTAQRMRNIYN